MALRTRKLLRLNFKHLLGSRETRSTVLDQDHGLRMENDFK